MATLRLLQPSQWQLAVSPAPDGLLWILTYLALVMACRAGNLLVALDLASITRLTRSFL